jgi:stage II sporulation protein AA (anti-sigma F factor antagonist)
MMDIFQSTSDSGILTLTLSGRLDADTTGAFSDTLGSCIDRGDRKVILDLGALDYISSIGLRAMIVGQKRLSSLGGRIVLCAVRPQILKLLEIAGFTSIFPVAATRDGAAELLR